MTTRKFYKTTFTVEIVSEEPIPDDMDYADMMTESEEGEYSSRIIKDTRTKINGKQAANLLLKQASDPEFFGLTDKGDDMECRLKLH
jgi:hypothetical protein